MDVAIKSNVQSLCRAKGWGEKDFIRMMVFHVQTSQDTAKKIWDGETNIRLQIASGVAAILGVDLGSLYEVKILKK